MSQFPDSFTPYKDSPTGQDNDAAIVSLTELPSHGANLDVWISNVYDENGIKATGTVQALEQLVSRWVAPLFASQEVLVAIKKLLVMVLWVQPPVCCLHTSQ